MRAGAFRHTVAVQVRSESAGTMGAGGSVSWATVSGMGSVRASIWPLKGVELIDAMKLTAKATHRIRMRYRSGITTANRLYWSDGGKTYNIVSMIDPDERHRMLEMLCEEVT